MSSRGPDARAVLGLGLAVLTALVCAVYAPVLSNGFVWDDWTVVVGTRALRPLTAEGLRWAFGASVMGHYHPATWLSYSAAERVLGEGAAASHAVNVALHAVNAALVAWLAALLFAHARPEWSAARRSAAALLAAAAFALHPLRVESVAWATERRDVLSAAFALAAVAAYVRRATARRRGAWLAASVGLYALAVLAKAQATVPAVLLVLDAYPLGRVRGDDARTRAAALFRLAIEKLPYWALAAAAAVQALRAQAASGALLTVDAHPLAARLAQAAYGLVFYLRATFATAFLPLHERPLALDWREPRFLLALLACALGAAAVVRARRRRPGLAAATAAYVILLLPVLGFFQSGVQLVAERYSYLATVGFALLAAAAAVEVSSRAPRRTARALVGGAAALLLTGWAVLAHRQAAVWRDDETLWRHVQRGGPSAVASNNLGQMLAARGAYGEAVSELVRSLEVVPTYPRPWTALQALFEAPAGVVPPDRARQALPVLARSAGRQPDSTVARYTLGLARLRAGDPAGAVGDFEGVLRVQPGHRGAASGLAAARGRLGQETPVSP